MLEEAFSSTTFPPAEAALGLLAFVRTELQAGGAAAEARFIRLFPLLCQRLFGPLETTGEFRHEPGGWLSRQSRWDTPTRSSSSTRRSPVVRSSSSTQTSKNSSLDSDPVVQLLAGTSARSTNGYQMPTLIEAISAETEHRPGVRFPFPLPALPKPMQDAMLAMLKSALGGIPNNGPLRDNDVWLCKFLLRTGPADQNELRIYMEKQPQKQEQKRPLQLSPGGPTTILGSSVPSPSPISPKSGVFPNIMLDMLEYYLFTFVRYPLATPASAPKQLQPQGVLNASQTSVGGGSGIYRKSQSEPPYGEKVYLHLFRGYLLHFMPHGRGRPPFIGFSGLNRESELFLHVVIEFWLDGDSVVPTTMQASKRIQERRQRSGVGRNSFLDLDVSYDMIQIKYSTPPLLVQKCILNLVNHVVADADISLAVTDSYNVSRGEGSSTSSATVGGAAGSPAMPRRGDRWCLSPSMTILQQSFYNYVRTTFRHAPIHVADSPFYTAMNAWLVWLEPWNVVLRKTKPTVSDFSPSKAKNFLVSSVSKGASGTHRTETVSVVIVPKANSRSRYSQKWEPYIAANLHLYTVPLVIYLRRARELDFSSREFHRSLRCVQRVFRVFSPPVVDTINRLLATPPPLHLSPLVAKHEQNLGEFSPSLLGGLNLSSCGQDMQNLLEEIYMQHMKTVRELDFFDRIASRLEGLAGQGTAGDELALKSLVRQAKIIANFPEGYEVIPSARRQSTRPERSESTEDGTKPDRLSSGLLSERGREQLVSGAVKCNPMDVAFVGDKMKSRPRSYEIPFLVYGTMRASNWLNRKLGLVQGLDDEDEPALHGEDDTSAVFLKLVKEGEGTRKHWFRINLRFLADYRNILFIGFVSWLWKMFRA